MEIKNNFIFEVDLNNMKSSSRIIVKKNQEATFTFKIFRSGQPVDLTNIANVSLSLVHTGQVLALTTGKVSDSNEVTFKLKASETATSGNIDALVLFYSHERRVSTIKFSYSVLDKLNRTSKVSNDKTQFEITLNDGPLSIQEKLEVTSDVKNISLSEDIIKEVIESRVSTDSSNQHTTYNSLKERLDNEHNKVQEELQIKAEKVYYTPQEYNAEGNGIVDDSVAFRNMLTDSVNFILTPKGTYLFNSPLMVYKSLTFMGESREETVLINGTKQVTYAATVEFNSSKNSLLTNLTLDGNIEKVEGDIYGGVVNLRIDKSENITVRDVNFVNNNHVGCMLKDSKNITFDNCNFNNLDGGINGQNGTKTDGVMITRCTFDGHSVSEPIFLPNAKNITIEHCKMLNKTSGHAMAFDGSQNIYINNIYVENCGNGIYLTERNNQRARKITVFNSIFRRSTYGNYLSHADEVEFINCEFVDGITNIIDCNKITFNKCKFIADTKACMVAFSESPSDTIQFIDCIFDNTNNKNFSNSFLSVYNNVKLTNILFERCKFINCTLFNGNFSTGSQIIMKNNVDQNGNVYSPNKSNVLNKNSDLLTIVGTVKPTAGFYKRGAIFLHANPTTHVGGINIVDGFAYQETWRAGLTVWSQLQVKLSNGIVVKALSSGTCKAGTEPIGITSANTETNPFVDRNGIKWAYLGNASNFVNFGNITS